jgi:hypothetical protein
MVIFELDTKQTQKTFTEIKRILTAVKSWKIATRIEITVLDGKVQLVGQGFVLELDALTTGSCKLVVPAHHWYELVKTSSNPVLKVVVSEGEAMVGKVSVRVQTAFFETDKILRSIILPANPKAIDYWKLQFQGYSHEELEFNGLVGRIEKSKKELDQSIKLAALKLSPFRISEEDIRDLVLSRIREKRI